jgi:hypothetical protein
MVGYRIRQNGGVGVNMIRELKRVAARENASMGLFLTLAPPTEELLDGKTCLWPMSQRHSERHRVKHKKDSNTSLRCRAQSQDHS